MKKALAVISAVFALAPMAMAQGISVYNAPEAGLPALNAGQTENFTAVSLSEAQEICDQVASANNQARCSAIRNEANPTNVQTYHCNCAR